MLPLISLAVVGVVAAVTITRSKRRGTVLQGPKIRAGKVLPPGTFQIVGQKIVEEAEVVLAVEDVPLDNRFGNQPFVSEHEFLRSAKVAVKMDLGEHLDSVAHAGLFSVVEGELRSRLARRLGVDIGAQFSRHICLKFTAAPGKKVLYRVVWKQSSQRGLFEIGVGRYLHHVPYMVTFGLTHAVQSVAIDAEEGGKTSSME